ncbi:MAG TPA: hypothetical protein VJB82_03595 [Candidatus Peribacterales bacterium]|nr:hypothetical protein [Candidatus Peribacterales bacterium]
MLRQFFVYSFLILPIFSLWGGSAAAVSESDIENAVSNANAEPFSDPISCGGLLHAGDMRALAYYSREKEPLACTVQFWCTQYNASGECTGTGCTLIYRDGLGMSSILERCNGGSCLPVMPHTACPGSIADSTYRRYECSGTATAHCYSYALPVTYEFTAFPYSYNCVVQYAESPVDSENDPAGFPDLVTRYDPPPFPRNGIDRQEPVLGSNLTVPSGGIAPHPRDSSMESLKLDRGSFVSIQNVVHPVFQPPLGLEEYPPLDQTIGKLLQPPQVKLIVPSGALGLQHAGSSFFQKLFPSLSSPSQPEPVEELVGSTPDALLLAAQYLRQIPIIEVEYVPVEVLAPSVSATEIEQRVEEWKAWRDAATSLAAAQGITMDSDLLKRINANIVVMQSYGALNDSIRRYRLLFPSYVHALLSYIESANTFFRDTWAEENAKRLEAWYVTYMNDLPALRTRLRSLYGKAAQVTQECLVPACRMLVLPVAEDAKPWNLFPSGSDDMLSGSMRAYLPEGPPLFADSNPAQGMGNFDQRVQWHPLSVLGSPLPDLTFDLSSLRMQKKITVPVLTLDTHPLTLPAAPPLDPATLAHDIVELTKALPALTPLHPPVFDLTFPALTLPDPQQSLFLVPKAPAMLPVWNDLLAWREERLDNLLAICDSSDTPMNFLVSEPDLYGSTRDPAAVRAVSFVAGGWAYGMNFFAPPSYAWSSALYTSGFYPTSVSGISNISLTWAPFCFRCSTLRPQRIIRQHIALDVAWNTLQDNLLTAIDTWNAAVRFHSVLPREELTIESRDREPHSGLETDLPFRLP